MILKRSRMIMFAVIAAIIVAAPISFYELLQPEPNLTFQNASGSGTIVGNFTLPTYYLARLNYSRESLINETAYVHSGNKTLGSIYLSSMTYVLDTEYGGFSPGIVFWLDGNFSNLHPTDVSFQISVSAPGIPANISNSRLSGMSYDTYSCNTNNISIPMEKRSGKQASWTFPLQYPSPVKHGEEFHFGMFGSNGSRIGEGGS
ncbi:MAG: hypothetical protein M1327_05620 [Candidatus Thermoplasmatota archaeon]|nr:hypothetical protein [Candidatus Thermoplasmatota archaeon]